MQKRHRVIREQEMKDGESAMISALANLLNAHVFSADDSGFHDVYDRSGQGRYAKWEDILRRYQTDQSNKWHHLTGDFWGGIMTRFEVQGGWPKIVDIFQTGVEHRFQIIDHGETMHWVRRLDIIRNGFNYPDFEADPRYQWV
jgi:hypothetical protein